MIKNEKQILSVIITICIATVNSFTACKTEQAGSSYKNNNISYNNRVNGEYLVKLKAGSVEEDINKYFGEFNIEKITIVSNRLVA